MTRIQLWSRRMFGSLAAADLFNRGSTSFPRPQRPQGKDEETLSCRPLCLTCLSNKLCAGLSVYERRARGRARETEKGISPPNGFILSHVGVTLETHIFTEMPERKTMFVLFVLTYILDKFTVCKLTADDGICVCVCVCGMHVSGWVL